MFRIGRVLVAPFLVAAFAAPTAAQSTPMADSAMKLGQSGQWEQAALFAQSAIGSTTSPAERCALLASTVAALARIGAYELGVRELAMFDQRCANEAAIPRYTAMLRELRPTFALPPLPTTGLDFSGVDQFFTLADLLHRDVEPTEAQWRALETSTGYRLSMQSVPTTRADLETALRPSKRARFDSVAARGGDDAARVQHIARAYGHVAALAQYRDSIGRALPVQQAVALASRYLPPHATEGKTPPLVAFALFSDDAYSLSPTAVVVDLDHVYVEGGLTELLAHEFHHSYLGALNRLQLPRADDPAAPLVRALANTRNEGIADLIDKPHPLTVRAGSGMVAYARVYNESYARTPEVIHSIDSALVVAAGDSSKLRDVGRRVQQLLPSNGHFNRSYVAREIDQTFGVDSLFPGVSNPFAFWRAYAEAEAKRGHAPPFSAKATALLDSLERRYVGTASGKSK